MVIQHIVIFGVHFPSLSGNITYLTCYLTLQDHSNEGSYEDHCMS